MEQGNYVIMPGTDIYQLPPLLIRGIPDGTPSAEERVVLAKEIVDAEDILPEGLVSEAVEVCKLNLAIYLADQYARLLIHWRWGDSVLNWIRQCELTFSSKDVLRPLLTTDLWPHASKSSFVDLLTDKSVTAGGTIELRKSVGIRQTFRIPPPIDCFSNQFLFYIQSPFAESAYQTWAGQRSDKIALFPPNRFHFEVHDLESVE